jgi:hypothetical protein
VTRPPSIPRLGQIKGGLLFISTKRIRKLVPFLDKFREEERKKRLTDRDKMVRRDDFAFNIPSPIVVFLKIRVCV